MHYITYHGQLLYPKKQFYPFMHRGILLEEAGLSTMLKGISSYPHLGFKPGITCLSIGLLSYSLNPGRIRGSEPHMHENRANGVLRKIL